MNSSLNATLNKKVIFCGIIHELLPTLRSQFSLAILSELLFFFIECSTQLNASKLTIILIKVF